MKPVVKAMSTIKTVISALAVIPMLVSPTAVELAMAVSEAAWTRYKTSTTSAATQLIE